MHKSLQCCRVHAASDLLPMMAISPVFFVASLLLLFSSGFAVDSKKNPADEIVSVINANRSAGNLSELLDSPGLGCIALQYIKAYEGQCSEVGDVKRPPESSFAGVFAPNCGVLARTLAPITGRFIGCRSEYVSAQEAFSGFLFQSPRSLQILRNASHAEIGAAVSGTDGGSPYFWCVLLSSGNKNGSSFVFEGDRAKPVRPGCFSGNDDDCSSAATAKIPAVIALVFFGLIYAL